jgi:hypothetical protein
MSKQITFTFEDKDYTLEYTRRTVRQMEESGFVAREIDNKPMTLLPQLFAGAFLAHHKYIKQEVIERIYNAMPNKEDLIGALAEMYNDPIVTLMDEPTEGNVEWTPSW